MDHETGNYYLRARYMNPVIGRFTGMDDNEGDISDPISLHKYCFVNDNPTNRKDPNGHAGEEFTATVTATPGINGGNVLVGDTAKLNKITRFSAKLHDFMARPEIEGYVTYLYDDGISTRPPPRWHKGDPIVGHITIGIGHNCSEDDINMYDKPGITRDQANGLLDKDLNNACIAVRTQITVLLNQYQFDALTSFTFNVGPTGLAISALETQLNQYDYKDVPELMHHFLRSGSGYPPGMPKRRDLEGGLFANGTY